jgi:hypothetical protein
VRRSRLIVLALLVGVISGGIYGYRTVDWHSYGPATRPVTEPTLDNSEVTVESVQFGGIRVDEELREFTWSQTVPMEIVARGPAGLFRWKRPAGTVRTTLELSPAEMKFRRLPMASFSVQAVRRSSLGNGSTVVWKTAASAETDRNGNMICRDHFWIPNVPGTYSIRIYLRKFMPGSSRSQRTVSSLVRTFPLTVVQPMSGL